MNTICRKQKWSNERNLLDYQPVYRIVTINDRLSEMQFTEQTTCLSRSRNISDRLKSLPNGYKQFKGPLQITTNYPDDGVFVIIDVNSEVIKEHSETPEIPPPSASQAESAILTFVKPPETLGKRKPIITDQTLNFLGLEMENCNDMKSFIWEDFTEPIAEQPDSLNSSRLSEYVEDFVADAPFAGLFKGSSLNLANDSNEGDILNSEIKDRRQSSTFRQSIASIKSANSAFASETESNDFDFNAAKAWDEINSIFESIANKQSKTKEKSEFTIDHSKLNIRKPADLLFNISEPENSSFNSNWCHSANTLIYSSVAYEVYYLGSTVIRELHGTASTRKSIQRLKCDEKQAADNGLLEDINSSTRILKKNNQQARFKVGIFLSRLGVRFVDSDNQNTICMHSIENINCVCQDADDLRYFAYITREADTYYCHVFMVDDVKLANEIILTLGQAFEVAYQLSLAGQQAHQESAHCDMKQPLTYIDIVENI